MKLVRARATREKIGQFMRELGRAVKSPGRVYFTGGVSAVLLLKKFEEVEENIVRYPAIEPMELRATLEKLARGEL